MTMWPRVVQPQDLPKFHKQSAKTPVKDNDINPVWEEDNEFAFEIYPCACSASCSHCLPCLPSVARDSTHSYCAVCAQCLMTALPQLLGDKLRLCMSSFPLAGRRAACTLKYLTTTPSSRT